MSSFYLRSVCLAALALATLGCDQGRKNPPDTTVRVVHAASSFGSIAFRRELSQPTELAFKNSADFTFDEDTYDFNIDVASPTSTTPIRTTFSREVLSTLQYTFVLTDVGGVITPVVLEYPPVPADSSQTQILALHAGTMLGALDLYLEPPGTDVATVAPRATIGFGQATTPAMVASGDYQLTLTAAGNGANVLLAETITLQATTSVPIVIVDGAGEGSVPLRVVMLAPSAVVLSDSNAPPEVRVINAANDGAPRDVAINSEFAPPLFSAVPHVTPTAYAPVPIGAPTVTVTPAGNPGAPELSETLATSATARYTLLVGGDTGALTQLLTADDGRRIADRARIRILNSSPQFASVDFFVVNSGTDIATVLPFAVLASPGSTGRVDVPPGTYDLVLRQNGTTNIISGPTPITLTAGGLFEVLAINGPDTASANLVLLEDF